MSIYVSKQSRVDGGRAVSYDRGGKLQKCKETDIERANGSFRRELGGSFRLSGRTQEFLAAYPRPGNIHGLLQRLEERGLVVIGCGRGGSRITAEGIAYYKTYPENNQ